MACSAKKASAANPTRNNVSQPDAYTKAEASKVNARLVQQQPGLPRTSPVPTYSSGILGIAQRVCVWIKEKFNSLERATSRFAYDNACRESLLALDLALSSGNKDFSKNQLLNFAKCRARQVAYLKFQEPETAKALNNLYQASLKARCQDRFEDLAKMSDTMGSVCRKNRKLAVEQRFDLANALCKLLERSYASLPSSIEV